MTEFKHGGYIPPKALPPQSLRRDGDTWTLQPCVIEYEPAAGLRARMAGQLRIEQDGTLSFIRRPLSDWETALFGGENGDK